MKKSTVQSPKNSGDKKDKREKITEILTLDKKKNSLIDRAIGWDEYVVKYGIRLERYRC